MKSNTVYKFNDIRDQIAALVFTNSKYLIPPELRDELGDLTEDWRQECYTLTLEIAQDSYGQSLTKDDVREISRKAQRGLYRFLTSYGWKRPKGMGYVKKEVPILNEEF